MDKEAIDTKTSNLTDKINEISKKFDIVEEITSDDIVEFVEEKVQDVQLYESEIVSDLEATEVINLENMVDDFKFVRDTLKELIQNGRRVLNNITLELLDADEDGRASLIMAFSELNNAISNNMKIYTNSYKEISTVLVNLEKIRTTETQNPKKVTNNVTINTSETISTVDLIAQLKEDK